MMIVVSPSHATEARALGRIMAAWLDEMPQMPDLHDEADNTAFLTRLIANGQTLTARIGDRIAGFLARDGAEISCLYVARAMRGQGVGVTLLDRAKSASDRLTLWTFQFNSRARAFYRREGFREIAVTDGAGNDEKLPDVRLEWCR